MRSSDRPRPPPRKKAKSFVDIIEARQPYDKSKTERSKRRAIEAADRLMREMDDFLKQQPARKG